MPVFPSLPHGWVAAHRDPETPTADTQIHLMVNLSSYKYSKKTRQSSSGNIQKKLSRQ